MTRRAKLCQGCQTSLERCRSYIGHQHKAFHQIFRERFCPCTKCIVKATCTDPKYSMMTYAGVRTSPHKCKPFFDAIREYQKYMADNNIRETRLKRKRINKAQQK